MNKATFILKILLLLCCYFNASAQVKWVRGSQLNFTGQFTQSFDSVRFVNNGGYDNGGFGSSTSPDQMIFSDFDGDKKVDLILKCRYNYNDGSSDDVFFLRFFKNDGYGNFTEITKSVSNDVIRVFRANGESAIFDFNKDGINDIFIGGGGFEGNAQATQLSQNYLSNPTLNLKYGIDYINVGSPNNPSYMPRMQFLYSDSLKLKDGSLTKFDTKYFASLAAQYISDINNDGYLDIVVAGSVFSYNSVTNSAEQLSMGFGYFENIQGQQFVFKNGINANSWLSKPKQLNVPYSIFENRADIGGGIIAMDLNSDGLKDILIESNNYTRTYINPSDTIYNAGISSPRENQTRIYLNSVNGFKEDSFLVIPNVNLSNAKLYDFNNDGLLDLIGTNDTKMPDSLIYSSNFQIYLNNGDKTFSNRTINYFKSDSLIHSDDFNTKCAPNNFFLTDIDNDGKQDILPIDYLIGPYRINGKITGDGSPFLRYGIYPTDRNTFYYKNTNNGFVKINIGVYPNWKFMDTSSYFNVSNPIFYNYIIKRQNSANPSILPQDPSILNYNFMMNCVYPVDINGDGKLDLFTFGSNYPISFSDQSFTSLPNLPNIQYPHPSVPSFVIFQCNPPKPIFNTTKYTFCAGDSLKLTVTNINKGDTLKWYYGTKTDLTNVSTKTFTDSTKLFVIRTDSIGCTISSDTVQLIKYSIPSKPTIAWNGTQFTATTTSTGIDYQWLLSNSAISGATSANYKPTAIGSYKIQITDANACKNVSDSFMLVVTAVDPSIETSTDHIAKIVPNPASTNVLLHFSQKPNQTLTIQLLNLKGQVLKQTNTNSQSTRISLSEIIAGNYIIQIIGKGYNQTQQLLITQ